MGRVRFPVSYGFFAGAISLPEGTTILDVQRGDRPGFFFVEALTKDADGEVEPTYDMVTMPHLFFKAWEKK